LFQRIDYSERIGGFYSLTLLQVEDGVVAKQNRLVIFSFPCLLVFLPVFADLPEDNFGAVFLFADVSSCFSTRYNEGELHRLYWL
jgi:hypothetical protein